MPSYVYYIETHDDDEIVIDRKTVASCDDHDQLREWFAGLQDREEMLQMKTRAFHMNPKDDEESLLWLSRINKALAATGIGISRVRQRAYEIGAMAPSPTTITINKLNQKVTNLKAELAAAQSAQSEAH